MSAWTKYGPGGFCENCDETHDHPLNNIVEEIFIDDEPAIIEEQVIIEEPIIEEQAIVIDQPIVEEQSVVSEEPII